jgi:hypothetical protein
MIRNLILAIAATVAATTASVAQHTYAIYRSTETGRTVCYTSPLHGKGTATTNSTPINSYLVRDLTSETQVEIYYWVSGRNKQFQVYTDRAGDYNPVVTVRYGAKLLRDWKPDTYIQSELIGYHNESNNEARYFWDHGTICLFGKVQPYHLSGDRTIHVPYRLTGPGTTFQCLTTHEEDKSVTTVKCRSLHRTVNLSPHFTERANADDTLLDQQNNVTYYPGYLGRAVYLVVDYLQSKGYRLHLDDK